MVPAGIVNQSQLPNRIAKAIRKLPKDAVRVRYNFGTDWTGDPSIFFRIVLTDAASRKEKLRESTQRIQNVLSDELQLQENWGLLSYFHFRSKSEEAERNDPEWK